MLTPIRIKINTLYTLETHTCGDSGSEAQMNSHNRISYQTEPQTWVLPASNHEFFLTGGAANLSVDVHGEQSTGTVEDRGK